MTTIADGLVSSLWRASWQGALGFVFVWLVCRVFSRRLSADARCWLWRLSYVKPLAGLFWAGVILLPLLSPVPRPALTAAPLPVSAAPQVVMPSLAASGAGRAPAFTEPKAQPPWGWPAGIAAVYALGVTLCLGRLLLAARRTRLLLRSASFIASEREAACVEGAARALGLRRVPALARCVAVDSPVLVAGTILLPAEAHYSDAELRMILAHELAHVRRCDLLWEWLGTAAQVLLFFHPGVVLARREERLARESAADALALQVTAAPPADYRRLLLSLAQAQTTPRPRLLGTVGVVEGGPPLRRRLLALRDAGSRRPAARRIALVLVPLTALVFLPWQMTHGQAPLSAPAPPLAAPNYPTMPAGNKTLSGVVLNEQHEPVAGLSVGLTWHWERVTGDEHQSGSGSGGFTTTDAQGRFTFTGLPAGSFDYVVGSQTHQYVNVRAPLTLRESDTHKTLRIVVSTGALVTGRVVDGLTGQPLPKIYVETGPIPPGGDLAKWDYWDISDTTVTDAQGRYQVRVLPGDVFVGVGRATDSTLLSRRVRYAAQRVTVARGATASAPDLPLFLRPIAVFAGPDGKPVANTQVRIIPNNLGHGGYILNDLTDNDGIVILGQNPLFESGAFSIQKDGRTASGTYRATPEGKVTITMGGQTTDYPEGTATIRPADGSAGIAIGTVVSEEGKPIPHARVHITETTRPAGSFGDYAIGEYQFSTDTTGVFRVPLDPAGQYHVYVRRDGFNQVSVSGETALTVAKGATLDLGTIHLTRADGYVAGRVVDSAGKPMSGVLVYVRGGKSFLSSSLTDAQGHFHVPNVVLGDVVHLKLCLKGESPDSGEALSQSNDEMDIPNVTAGTTEREIVWHPDPQVR